MPKRSGDPASARYAITDLFDEQRGTFLIQYPILLVLGLALTGVAAFALTGFLGYSKSTANIPADTSGIAAAFHQAWLLFLWFCALLVTLQVSILRDKSLRSRLIFSLVVSVLAIVVIGVTYFSQSLPDIIRQLLENHRLLVTLAQSRYTYSVVNFGLLAIFWVDTVRRWMRRAHGEAPNPNVDIGIESGKRASKSTDLPSLQELVSGDLIAGAVLTLLLAGLFWFQGFLPSLIHPQSGQVSVHVTECMLSWPFGACGVGATHADPPTLTFINLFQTLIYLPLGLLILALSATLSGFGAVGGVDEAVLGEINPHHVVSETGRAGAAPIAQDVAITVIDTLRAALNRRLKLLGGSLALSLRTVAWPILIVVAVYGVANLSTYVEDYLHSPKHLSDVVAFVVPAAIYGAVAVLGAILSPALMLFKLRVAENTARFLGLIGFIVLLTFWIFSLALTGVDRLLRFTGATNAANNRQPFYPPSFATAVSLGALVIFGAILLLRRSRGAQSASASVAVPSAQPRASGDGSSSLR